ncbi:MAG TPA: GMC family oxidoreductase [Anaeromyxobacteraceae bacterium]|nr:GMC family oxidoreductase [Anaeromyxobacteraceae bacterium]
MTSPDYDFVVVGSGFGGSVAALRLAEKGWRVAVVEQGKRWRDQDFARTNWNLRKFLWMPRLGLHGIQQITLLRDVLVLHGAGVGGGSLVYANILLRPPDRAFRDPRWPGGRDWKAELAPHYHLASWMLGVADPPRTFAADDLLQQVVEEETGRGHTFSRHPVGVFFGEPDRTVPDPYFGGEGPERTGCIFCGECMTGCRHDAKNTLVKNYLWLAERRGCQVHPETRVQDLRPLPGGGWEVHTVGSTSWLRRQPRVLRAGGVVLAAGTLGTVRLLLECRARGSLPGLSDQLGNWVRTNSEALLGATARDEGVDYSQGIAITSGVWPDDDTHVEIVRYGKGQDFMALMATYLTGGGPPWPRWLRWLGNMIRHPLAFARAHWPFGWARRTAIMLVMQPLSSFMRLRLHRRPWGQTLVSEAGGERPPTYFPLANRLAERMAKKMRGTPGSVLPEVLFGTSSTAHILGGATMGRTPADGVCDERGRVFGHENLWVADGSLVPANLGVNPSLTITALAEYVMSQVPANPAGAPRPAPRPPAGREGPPRRP